MLATATITLAQRHSLAYLADAPTLSVGFCQRHLLDRRVRRLAGEPAPAHSRVTRQSVIAALATLSLAWSAGC